MTGSGGVLPPQTYIWRRTVKQDLPRDRWRAALESWIASRVIEGVPQDEGMLWIYRAVLRLERVQSLVREAEADAAVAARGVTVGARIRVNQAGGVREGVVVRLRGWWADLDSGETALLIAPFEVLAVAS